MRPEYTPPFIERFWSKVDRSGGPDACWPFVGCRTESGYGKITVGGKTKRANRVALELSQDTLDDDAHACHRCDNPPCCNPAHLFEGTPTDNVQDAIGKQRRGGWTPEIRGRGRGVRGEANYNARLTEDAVRAIKALHGSGATFTEIGQRFGVNRRTVSRIIAGERWPHME